jgi:2-keto-3-deoxy-L-rhamnonate aldolase RhmA
VKDNRLRKALNEGNVVIGTMLQEVRTPAIPILLANLGYDFIFIDMEHGAHNMETVADLIKVTRLTGMVPLVRVPELQYHFIARCLDAGAQGIMIPRVETREQVEAIVSFSKYPPVGERGCSINKGHNDYQSEALIPFMEKANRENIVILQIERKKAMENLNDLLSVPGVDAAVLGPNDLAASYGVPNDLDSPLMTELFQKVVDTGKKYGVHTGMHIANLVKLKEWMAKGMHIIAYNTDLGFLKSSASAGLSDLREHASAL